jgi:hypothetical protein
VVRLTPRLSFVEQSRQWWILKEEDPFHCIRCGKAFGTRSSIERLVEKLSGHPAFAGSGRLDLMRMCEDCRVVVQFEDTQAPFRSGEQRRPRTADDYRGGNGAGGTPDD